jgi:uncharacterized lipoprotein YehR (DUF1307 family)
MQLNNMSTEANSRSYLDFSMDDVKHALIEYAESKGYSFNAATTEITVTLPYQDDRVADRKCSLCISKDGTMEPSIKEGI